MGPHTRGTTRRDILRLALLGMAGLALPAGALGAGRFTSAEEVREELRDVLARVGKHHPAGAVKETALTHPYLIMSDEEIESPPHVPFSQELPFPPLAVPDSTAFPSRFGPADHYTIVQQVAHREYIPGLRTPIWGYNGIQPGPTILARLGKPVVVTQVNRLPAPTIVHLHGGHQPHEDDGFASDRIEPGTSRDFHYLNRPDSHRGYTEWYHDHREEVTSQHVYLGLAAFYLMDDEYEEGLRAARLLPGGIAGTVPRDQAHDIPMLLEARTFAPDGRLFQTIDPGHKGNLGDKLMVNGAIQPLFRVATRKYRFRILNGGPARDFNLALSNGMPFLQIGTDGGLMIRPVERKHLLISVAERYEVILDFSGMKKGQHVDLLNLFGQKLWDEDDPVPLMRFVVDREEKDDVQDLRDPRVLARLPGGVLRPVEPRTFPDPSRAVRHRKFVFERKNGLWVINDRVWDHSRDDARPRADTVEIWDLVNGSGGWVHPLHVHEELHRTLLRNGKPAPDYEALGYKDTNRIGPKEEVRIVKFFSGEFAGSPDSQDGRFVFHCHNSDHEDHHMMGVFHIIKE